ncbi:proton-conducting transporter membrane subunit [Buchnera aphidicola]|uniref:proton-conducting transporter transmembrane domain-containing protein n=1 Tax=Buchnera aphidicola TaxID=9 RepID=UPI0031B6F781
MILDSLKNFIPIFSIFVLMFSIIIILLNKSFYKNFLINYYIVLISLVFCFSFLFFSDYKIFLCLSKFIIYDDYSRIFFGLLYISGFFSYFFLYHFSILSNEEKDECCLLLLISILGGILVGLSTNIILFIMGLELLFLPLIGLINFSNTSYSLIVSLKYFFISILMTLLLLLGFSLLYLIFGNLKIFSIFLYFFSGLNFFTYFLMIMSILLIIFSLFFKLSLFPFHFFILDIYKYVFSPILIYYSVASKISIVLFLVRFFSKIYYLRNVSILYQILFFVLMISIFYGNFMAYFQKNIKIVLSYTSISQIGIILMILLNNPFLSQIFPEFLIGVMSYILGIICFFSILSIIEYFQITQKKLLIDSNSLIGLFWYSPFLGSALVVLFFLFSGFPLTLGFWSKLYLLRFSIHENLWYLLGFLGISSFFSIFCYLPFLKNIFIYPINLNEFYIKKKFKISFIFLIIIFFLIFFLIFLGFFPFSFIYIFFLKKI